MPAKKSFPVIILVEDIKMKQNVWNALPKIVAKLTKSLYKIKKEKIIVTSVTLKDFKMLLV